MKKVDFSHVIGHEEEKREIINIINWFNNAEKIKSQGLEIPRGILLYGNPGNGKTMMLKAIINSVDAKVLVYDDSITSVSESLRQLFSKAHEIGHCIIVIDELDLLINEDHLAIRILQEFMDGLSNDDDFLIIAAANRTDAIPRPLQRPGRFGKPILINNLFGDDLYEMFIRFMSEYKIKMVGTIDKDYVVSSLQGYSCVAIKMIVNDIALRYGFDDITDDIVFEAIHNFRHRFDKPHESSLFTATHEAGHAIMINRYHEFFKFKSIELTKDGGTVQCILQNGVTRTYEVMVAEIDVALSGVIATKLIYKQGNDGCASDLEMARNIAESLVNSIAYKGVDKLMGYAGQEMKKDSGYKHYCVEKKYERILRNEYRKTKRYLKKHIKEVRTLADKIYQKGHLSVKEIYKCLNKEGEAFDKE